MSIKKHIPNTFTSANLLLGCLALIEVFQGKLENVIFYTLLAGLMDFFDGFLARLLKVNSNIGKDLDSLADLVSFGVVPAFVVFGMIGQSLEGGLWQYVPLIIAVLSGVRLAKFNNDDRQTDHFHGLPVPANALFICTLPILALEPSFTTILNNEIILAIISVVMALFLITDIKLIAFKFRGYGWQGNQSKYLLICISLVGLLTFQLIALPFLVILYLLTSIFVNALTLNK